MAPSYIIAEMGSNHDEDLDQAKALIDIASQAGADAVKLQCLPNLPIDWMPELQDYADTGWGLDFLATPFDPKAVAYLASLRVPYLKIASAEILHTELLEAAGSTDIPILLSTGMATYGEIEQALGAIGHRKVTLLQCTAAYPARPEQANLYTMQTMEDAFGLKVGLSDHTLGIAVPIAAAALGATVIEKHFTLSRKLDGPDHPFALEPDQLKAMVDGIREAEAALGDGIKRGPVEGEMVEVRGRRLTWTN